MLVLKILLSDKGVPLALQTKEHMGFEQISLQFCSRLSEWMFLFLLCFPSHLLTLPHLRSVCVSALWLSTWSFPVSRGALLIQAWIKKKQMLLSE